MNERDGIGAYGEAWLEQDEARREALVERAWAADAVYADPTAFVRGRAELVRHIGEVQAALPGGQVVITAEAVRHHDSAWFPWRMLDATGDVLVTGFDVVQLDDEGRITRLTGFFDPPPGSTAG